MRQLGKRVFGLVLLMAAFLLPARAPTSALSQGENPSGVEAKAPIKGPDLADIIPQAVKLSGRLIDLERDIKGVLDVSAAEKKCTSIETNMKGYGVQFQQLMNMKDYRITTLMHIRQDIEQENERLEAISRTLSDEIRKLVTWREEWLAEKRRWDEWRSFLSKQNALEAAKSVSAKATGTIETALALVSPKLEALLEIQARIGDNQAEASALDVKIDDLFLVQRRGALLNDAPPMFTRRYLFQFTNELWLAVKSGLHNVAWPDSEFFVRAGWIIFLHSVLTLLTIAAVYRKRTVLSSAAHWRLLAERPVSAGLFIGAAIAVPFYEYWGVPLSWKPAYLIIMGVSFTRLAGGWIAALWKRRLCAFVKLPKSVQCERRPLCRSAGGRG